METQNTITLIDAMIHHYVHAGFDSETVCELVCKDILKIEMARSNYLAGEEL